MTGVVAYNVAGAEQLRAYTKKITDLGGTIISVCPQPPVQRGGGLVSAAKAHNQYQDHAAEWDMHRIYFDAPDSETLSAINAATVFSEKH